MKRGARNIPYEIPGATSATHRCAHPQCRAKIPKEFLMCHRHWSSVPKPQRDAVWRTWIRWRNGSNGEGLQEYQAARQAAIASVPGRPA